MQLPRLKRSPPREQRTRLAASVRWPSNGRPDTHKRPRRSSVHLLSRSGAGTATACRCNADQTSLVSARILWTADMSMRVVPTAKNSSLLILPSPLVSMSFINLLVISSGDIFREKPPLTL